MPISDQLQTLRPNAAGLREAFPAAPQWWIDDYITILNNLITVFSATDGIETDLTSLALQVAQNSLDIAQNAVDIATNATDIATNASNFTAHDASDSEHGVTGTNIGTGDFPTLFVGGAVLLSALVADAVASTATVVLPDVGAAPVAYDQTYAQSQTDLINDVKAKHNQLVIDLNAVVTQFNTLLANMKAANQMSPV